MFLLSLLGLGAICAAEKIHDTYNCNTYKYKDDYEGWRINCWRPGAQIARQQGGIEAERSYWKSHGIDPDRAM